MAERVPAAWEVRISLADGCRLAARLYNPNRLGFKERLKRAARRAHDQGDMIAVHSIDLDRFKEANDRYGHPAGDALLQAVAGRLGGMLRDDDFAVRLGGDEFVIVQTAVGHSQEALLLARRAIATLNEPFAVDGHEIEIGASIGIAVGSQMADVETLMSAADKALYKSKSNGRNRASFAHLAEAALFRTAGAGRTCAAVRPADPVHARHDAWTGSGASIANISTHAREERPAPGRLWRRPMPLF
jgi:diguanylate cyclase (GGDEF)-like protein